MTPEQFFARFIDRSAPGDSCIYHDGFLPLRPRPARGARRGHRRAPGARGPGFLDPTAHRIASL